MRHGWIAALAACVLLAGPAAATAPGASVPIVVPQGEPQPGGTLRDDDFGVVRRGFGLERRVEMYQWSAGDTGFRRVWNSAPIDSSGFPDNRQNPPQVPLDSRRWWSSQANLDGHPIDVEVLKRLGDWQQFRPGFSRLPGNLAATFQPDGDGLSSSNNPLDPQIGDLRVTWRELQLPPLAGKIRLRDGAWQLAPREPVVTNAAPPAAPASTTDRSSESPSPWPWRQAAAIALAALVAGIIAIAVVLRRRRRRT